tara:strand:- start:309 stop:941 length:633 start_codon:yes stop_codon:yes gene_type:complete
MENKAKARNIAYSHLGLLSADANNIYELLKREMSMRIVRVEDFSKYSKYIMTKLCDYLKIDYDGSLEISSFGSKLYWGANPNYKNNKFSKIRHLRLLPLKRRELIVFSIMNKRLNKITGYRTIKLSWLEKKLVVLWLLLPFPEDIRWLKKEALSPDYSGNYQNLFNVIKWIKNDWFQERKTLLKINKRNSYSNKNYDLVKKYIINPNDEV